MLAPQVAFRVRDSLFPSLASTAEFNVTGFAGATGAVLVLLLVLARASHSMIENDGSELAQAGGEPDEHASTRGSGSNPGPAPEPVGERETPPPERESNPPEREDRPLERETPPHEQEVPPPESDAPTDHPAESQPAVGQPESRPDADSPRSGARSDDRVDASEVARTASSPVEEMTTAALLANVAFSHGVLAVVLVGAAILTAVPPAALGVRVPTTAALGVGVGLGVALYVASEVGAAMSELAGLDRDESLREMLAPESTAGWVLLLFGVLPVIAGFEELLFRGALIGAMSVGFGVSPWLLAVLSSVAFGLGHGVQGASGIVVTGVLGFVLAAAFVLTGSLAVVIVAHYLVNALEFLVHEGLGIEWLV